MNATAMDHVFLLLGQEDNSTVSTRRPSSRLPMHANSSGRLPFSNEMTEDEPAKVDSVGESKSESSWLLAPSHNFTSPHNTHLPLYQCDYKRSR